jgi:hypothetical protein
VTLTCPILWGLKWALGLWEGPSLKGAPAHDSLTDHQVGGIGVRLSGVDVPAFVSASNIAKANGWTVSAYPNTDDDKHQVLETFLQSGGATYAQRAGKISCISRAAPRASLVTISARDTAGPLEIDTAASRIDRINTLRPRFWSPAHRWQMTAMTGEVTAQAYRDEDGGRTRSRGIDFPFVSDARQTGQLAALQIANTREGIAGVVPLKPHLQRIRPGDAFTITEPGFVLDGLKCLCLNTDYNAATGVVRVSFVSETDGKYPFALGQNPTPPSPQVLTPVDPRHVTPPEAGDWTITPRPPAPGGGQLPGFDLTGFVSNATATAIIVETGPSADGPWAQTYQGPPTVTNIPVDGLQPGATYFIAIQYQRGQNYSDREVFGPFTAPALIADDTNNVGGRPAPEVIQQLDDILIDVDGIRTDVGTALDQASEAKTLAASSGYPSMNPNPVYAKPWESGVPPEWSAWGNGTANARRAAGVESQYGFQIDVPSTGTVQDASRGLFQPNGVGALNTATGDAFYVAELTVRLDAGLLNGTGMHVQFYNASGGVIGSTNINASADEPLGAPAPGNGVVGRVYRYAKLFKTEPGTVTLVPYAMALWEGYFGQAVGKTVTFTKCRIRPAEAGEIEEGKARGSYPTLEARLTDQNTSLVSATAALALRQSVTEARATTLPNRLRNSDAALKLRYWDSTGSGALWSYYDDANFGTLFGALGGPEGADYFLISDRVAVYGNSTYTVSFEGDGGTRPGEAYLYISQLDAAGNYIPAGDGLGMINFGGVSWTTRKSTTFTTRSDCAFIRVVFLKKGGAGFNAFVSRIMLNATVAVVGWTDAATAKDIGGRVETSEGVLATVTGRVQAWFQKVVQAGDGTAFIQAKAIDDNGNVTSEVNLGARKIGMFTQIGNGWVEVLKLIGTSAHFAGKVFLGALQQITFDPDIPALIFTPPGGTVKMLYGAGFGANADCIMWLGPKTTDVSQISRTNGNWAFGTDGKVYYGTAELGTGGGSSAGYKTMDGSESNFSNYSVIAEAEVSNFAANSYVEADIMTVTQGWFQNQQDTYEGVMKLTAQLVSGGAEVTIFEETCYAQNSELQIPGGGFQASWSYPFGAKAVNLGGPVRFRWYCRKTFGTAPGGVHRMTIKITPPA